MQIDVTATDDGRTLAAAVGDVIAVRLPENPSTGYRWSLSDIDALQLVIEDRGYRQESPSVGGGGYAYWTLRAASTGRFRIEAQKSRPWQGAESIICRFSLTLEIGEPRPTE